MKRMSKEEFAKWMCQRTKRFAIRILQFCQALPKEMATKVIVYQLIKAATSTAGNYRAACRARSKAEFFSKISIVVEEADETLFCLEVIDEGKIKCNKQELEYLTQEALEILSIVATARKNTNRY